MLAPLGDIFGHFYWTSQNIGTTFVTMSKLSVSIAAIFLFLSQSSPLNAQQRARISPHDTTKATIDGDEITIVYGRPYTKEPKTGEKRKICGGLVSFDEVWSLGGE